MLTCHVLLALEEGSRKEQISVGYNFIKLTYGKSQLTKKKEEKVHIFVRQRRTNLFVTQ